MTSYPLTFIPHFAHFPSADAFCTPGHMAQSSALIFIGSPLLDAVVVSSDLFLSQPRLTPMVMPNTATISSSLRMETLLSLRTRKPKCPPARVPARCGRRGRLRTLQLQ